MRPRFRFVFTGFRQKNADERAHLVNKIQSLGGVYYESEHFKQNCTHVVCARLCRSEKFLCACAAGKWIVTPEFIEKSFAAKKWLKEDDYEWKFSDLPDNANGALVDLCRAPKRSRQFVAWQNGKGQFVGKTFVLFMSEQKNRVVYKSILTAGGAKVLIESPPNFNLSSISSPEQIKFVLVTQKSSCLRPILRLNVLCISTDYIRNFLLKNSPPDISEFDITSYVPNSDAYYQVGLSNSPLKQVLTNPPSNSAFFRKTYSTLRSTDTVNGKLSPKLVPIVIRENMEEIKRKNRRNCCSELSMTNDQKNMQIEQNQPDIRSYFTNPQPANRKESTKIKSNANTKKRKLDNDFNPAKRRILSPILNRSGQGVIENHSVSDAKSEMEEKNETLSVEVAEMQRICAENANERRKKHWKKKIPLSEETNDVCAYPVSCFIESCSAEQDWRLTIRNFTSLISPRYLLPAEIIRKLIDTLLLNGPCEAAASQTYSFLSRMLRALPPHNYMLRKWYLSMFEDNSFFGSWNFISRVICGSLTKQTKETTSMDEKRRFSHTLFLHFLESLLEKDFARFILRCTDVKKELKSATDQPMIVRLLWGTKSTLSFSNSCLDLLKYLVASITDSSPYTTILMLQKLSALMLESARLSEAQDGVVDDIPYNAIELIRGLADWIQNECDEFSGENLLLLLDTMELAWTRMVLAQALLDASSRSISDAPEQIDRRLTLHKIVNHYMKSIPRHKTECQRSKPSLPAPDKAAELPMEKMKRVNRRNCKGETPLHRACIQNRVDSVRRLLAHPDVDINAVDHAGWTPLHEACNRGNIDCVRLLLQFQRYDLHAREIDIMAKNVDNMTPLHDAVINNHVAIAQLLLKRGGRVLLDQTDNENRQPMHFAKSDAMRSLLLNFKEVNRSNSIPKFEDAQVEKYVTLVFHLLHGYLDTHNLKETSEKWLNKMDSIGFRDSTCAQESVLDDVKIYQHLDQHTTEFTRHVTQLLTAPKEILLLDLFKLISF